MPGSLIAPLASTLRAGPAAQALSLALPFGTAFTAHGSHGSPLGDARLRTAFAAVSLAHAGLATIACALRAAGFAATALASPQLSSATLTAAARRGTGLPPEKWSSLE
ncbi:hypothetical protein [Pararhodobacter sp. CCB-MM2]|uniref:hypothetical protein n=1 Tax=Pararhodobacter sp. CCB-MM2 TaxID=1786003 RepID=UPI00111255EE|nr:hypothetical protein [Pararhodobacter sp. CCB-MM2]